MTTHVIDASLGWTGTESEGDASEGAGGRNRSTKGEVCISATVRMPANNNRELDLREAVPALVTSRDRHLARLTANTTPSILPILTAG